MIAMCHRLSLLVQAQRHAKTIVDQVVLAGRPSPLQARSHMPPHRHDHVLQASQERVVFLFCPAQGGSPFAFLALFTLCLMRFIGVLAVGEF